MFDRCCNFLLQIQKKTKKFKLYLNLVTENRIFFSTRLWLNWSAAEKLHRMWGWYSSVHKLGLSHIRHNAGPYVQFQFGFIWQQNVVFPECILESSHEFLARLLVSCYWNTCINLDRVILKMFCTHTGFFLIVLVTKLLKF